MLNSIFSQQTIDSLVESGVIDVIKRCSLNTCKDIAYEVGPHLYPLIFQGTLLIGSMGLTGYALYKHQSNKTNTPVLQPDTENNEPEDNLWTEIANKINPVHILGKLSQ